jgi:hypothetical protein
MSEFSHPAGNEYANGFERRPDIAPLAENGHSRPTDLQQKEHEWTNYISNFLDSGGRKPCGSDSECRWREVDEALRKNTYTTHHLVQGRSRPRRD